MVETEKNKCKKMGENKLGDTHKHKSCLFRIREL